MSELNLRLLADTHWYRKINTDNVEPITWGKDKRCGFLKNICYDTTTTYEEFKFQIGCSFHHEGVGGPMSDPYMDGCLFNAPFRDYVCSDEEARFYWLGNTAQFFGAKSKCFESTVVSEGGVNFNWGAACHRY